ncbi:MAG: hypothetical protein Q9160_000679 [Pyrenula sp. 1 TL-2023]
MQFSLDEYLPVEEAALHQLNLTPLTVAIMILKLFFGLALAWSTYSAVSLYQNVRRARALGLPTNILPVSPMNTIWAVSEPLVFGIIDKLPFRLGSLNRYGRRAWHFHEKATSHLELGDAFAIVSPREIFVYVSDPDAIVDIFARRADFARPLEIYQMLAVYGSNVSTVGWSDWQRQRKIVAAAFNENTHKLVWTESLAQAKDMLQAWTCSADSGVEGTAQDTRTLSLDVLAATGFRKSYAFRSSNDPASKSNASRGYRESLKVVMDNSIFMMIAPPKILSLPIAPKKWQRVAQATSDFKEYMMTMLNDEKDLLKKGKSGTGTLMTSLIRQSEDSKKPNADSSKTLSVQEILGNVFVINFAGHDTTANTGIRHVSPRSPPRHPGLDERRDKGGTYFPWSDGPQFCPGKKFAQVEFVAVLATLFRDHRVKPALNKGESEANGRKRALGVCEDSEHVLLLRMRDGDSTRSVWERVEGKPEMVTKAP